MNIIIEWIYTPIVYMMWHDNDNFIVSQDITFFDMNTMIYMISIIIINFVLPYHEALILQWEYCFETLS